MINSITADSTSGPTTVCAPTDQEWVYVSVLIVHVHIIIGNNVQGMQDERTRKNNVYCARGLLRGTADSLLGGDPEASLLGVDLEMTAFALSCAM